MALPLETAQSGCAELSFDSKIMSSTTAADTRTALCCGSSGENSNYSCEPWTHLQINVVSNSDALTQFTNESCVAKTSSEVASVLNATSIHGAMRGLQRFSQLAKFNMTSATCTMFAEVTDFPRFEHRGVIGDTSRNFVSLAELRIGICNVSAPHGFAVLVPRSRASPD